MEKVTRLPKCIFCKHFDMNKKICPAHPGGLDEDTIMHSILLKPGEECAKGIKYERDDK